MQTRRQFLPGHGKIDAFDPVFAPREHGAFNAKNPLSAGDFGRSRDRDGRPMEGMKAHPNTQAVLDAWKRLSDGQLSDDGPTTDDYPGVVGRLFVLNQVSEADYAFRRVGYALERLFGRALAEHSFLSVWGDGDRLLVAAALGSAVADAGPTLIHARGETLDGRRVDLEFALAPLIGKTSHSNRFLGLCQAVTAEDGLAGRPLRRLQVVAVYPPAPDLRPAIRLVSSR
jgi:hypothetical protein